MMMTREQRIKNFKALYPSRDPSKAKREKCTFSRAAATMVAERAARSEDSYEFGQWLERTVLPCLPESSAWFKCFKLLAERLTVTGEWPSLFAKGNGKLPFYTWSELPLVTCPGKGDCVNWCYSLRAWRYPAAFCRQLLNTLLAKHEFEVVEGQFLALPKGVAVRLFVDGDFSDREALDRWMVLIARRPDLRVYGYSKSQHLFIERHLEGKTFPANYVLNLSSGSRFDDRPDYQAALLSIQKTNGKPLVRERFLAVDIDGEGIENGDKRYTQKSYHDKVRARLQELGLKGVSCPGKCGDCAHGKHLCGNEDAAVPIAIGIH